MDRYRDSVMSRPQVLVLWLLCVRSSVKHNLDAVIFSEGLSAKDSVAIIRLRERMRVRAKSALASYAARLPFLCNPARS